MKSLFSGQVGSSQLSLSFAQLTVATRLQWVWCTRLLWNAISDCFLYMHCESMLAVRRWIYEMSIFLFYAQITMMTCADRRHRPHAYRLCTKEQFLASLFHISLSLYFNHLAGVSSINYSNYFVRFAFPPHIVLWRTGLSFNS